MEKLFLIGTTTGHQWEIVGGNYLVRAESKDEAIMKLEDTNSVRIRQERVVGVVDVDELTKDFVSCDNYPYYEGGGIFVINNSIEEQIKKTNSKQINVFCKNKSIKIWQE